MPSDTNPLFAPPRVTTSHDAEGNLLLDNPHPLPPAARCVGEWLIHWAEAAPDRVLFAERAGDEPRPAG